LSAPVGDLTNAIQNFIPYSVSLSPVTGVQINVIFTDDAKSAVYAYTWGAVVGASVSGTKLGKYLIKFRKCIEFQINIFCYWKW
jgi:hypothetical protein